VSFSDITLGVRHSVSRPCFFTPLGYNLNLFSNEQDIDASCGINVFAATTRYVLCDIQCVHPRAPFDKMNLKCLNNSFAILNTSQSNTEALGHRYTWTNQRLWGYFTVSMLYIETHKTKLLGYTISLTTCLLIF